jgi:hypothetical protein
MEEEDFKELTDSLKELFCIKGFFVLKRVGGGFNFLVKIVFDFLVLLVFFSHLPLIISYPRTHTHSLLLFLTEPGGHFSISGFKHRPRLSINPGLHTHFFLV